MEPTPTPQTAPTVPVPTIPEQPKTAPRSWTPWVIAAVVLIAALAVGVGWFLQIKPNGSVMPTATPDTGVLTPTPTAVPSGSPDPRLIDDLPIILPDAPNLSGEDSFRFYRIGTITQAPYEGADLIVADVMCEGPCFYPMRFRFVRMSDGRIILLQKYSAVIDEYTGLDKAKFAVDPTFTIAGLEMPDLITAPNGAILELDPTINDWFDAWAQPGDLVPSFTHPSLGQVYIDRQDTEPTPTPDPETGAIAGYRNIRNGFYVRLVDGSVAVYQLKIPAVPIVWGDGKSRTGEYDGTNVGGCGSKDYAAVVPPYELDIQSDLVKAGTLKSGDTIYEYRDPQHPYLRNMYDNEYVGVWLEAESRYGNKMSYTEFLDAKPAYFWEDPFGRLIRFRNRAFAYPAECGKPVIYLYPRDTTVVSVKVSPKGGMLVSEPSYGDGWTVTAQPDGRLTDAAGAQWPYLFWEGRGGLYEQPDKGWVVARDDVDGFLDDKLVALGLADNEIDDFKGFWLPRMQKAPYYFVTFLGNRAMDELAPLAVSPEPDTIIRVLMDFSPLTEPIDVQPFTIRTPTRDGFTVVEWGGVIR